MTVAFAGNTGLKGLQGSAFRAGISLTKKAKYFPNTGWSPSTREPTRTITAGGAAHRET